MENTPLDAPETSSEAPGWFLRECRLILDFEKMEFEIGWVWVLLYFTSSLARWIF